MIVQVFRSSTVNMDGRWWFGVKRWPSRQLLGEKLAGWSMPRAWFIGVGPVQVRLWPGISKQTADVIGPKPASGGEGGG